MVGQEIGADVAARYGRAGAAARRRAAPAPPAFDFRAFMRETRARTEQLLATGEVDGPRRTCARGATSWYPTATSSAS